MEACVIICNKNKADIRRGKVQFINAKDWTVKDPSGTYLSSEHIHDILSLYDNYTDEVGRCAIIDNDVLLKQREYALTVGMFVPNSSLENYNIDKSLSEWEKQSHHLSESINELAKFFQS